MGYMKELMGVKEQNKEIENLKKLTRLTVPEMSVLHNSFEMIRLYYVKDTDKTTFIYKYNTKRLKKLSFTKTCKGRFPLKPMGIYLYCWAEDKIRQLEDGSWNFEI